MPLLSVLTAVHDPEAEHLDDCLRSVDTQFFDGWEHVVVDDASTRQDVTGRLQSDRHPFRRVIRRSVNGGITQAGADAASAATGEFLVLLDHDDVLAPQALGRLADTIAAHPGVDVIYSDHDLLRPDGRRTSPVYKPDFSPERLRNHNYITHLVAIRRAVFEAAGGFVPGYDGAQDHELLLRVSERTTAFVHLPEVLLHWRQSPRSVAGDTARKPEAFDAGRRAVADHLTRLGVEAEVSRGAHDGLYRIRRSVRGAPLVSVVVPTRGSTGRVWGRTRHFVVDALTSLRRAPTEQCRLEFVVVVDPASDPSTVAALRRAVPDARLVDGHEPFNFSRCINTGVAASTGRYVLLLNDDTELVEPDSIDELVGLAQLDDVGIVGAKLLYEDGTLQHGGHVYNGTIDHACRGWSGTHPGPHRLLAVERECSGVTAAAALMRREVFDAVGGFADDLPGNYNDVDFSLRVRRAGLRNLWTPHAVWWHFESRSFEHPIVPEEIALIEDRWGDALVRDPYYNVNLAPGRTDWLERPGRSGAPPYEVLPDGTVVWA